MNYFELLTGFSCFTGLTGRSRQSPEDCPLVSGSIMQLLLVYPQHEAEAPDWTPGEAPPLSVLRESNLQLQPQVLVLIQMCIILRSEE